MSTKVTAELPQGVCAISLDDFKLINNEKIKNDTKTQTGKQAKVV
jgi:hypothetical protein